MESVEEMKTTMMAGYDHLEETYQFGSKKFPADEHAPKFRDISS